MQFLNRIPHFDSLEESIQNIIKINIHKCKIINKIDGCPSIFFGRYEGKLFIATKSLFNKKKVKINYSISDIELNHGTNQSLSFKLKLLFSLIENSNIEGIWNADYLYDFNSIHYKFNKGLYFTPNTVTYEITQKNSLYKDVNKAKLGLYIHTYIDSISNNPREWKFSYILSNDQKEYICNLLQNNKIFCLNPYEQQIKNLDDNIFLKLNKNPYINSYINDIEVKEGEGYCLIYDEILCKLIRKDIFTLENNRKWGRI